MVMEGVLNDELKFLIYHIGYNKSFMGNDLQDINKLTLVKLRKLCKSNHLDQSGKKEELIHRVQSYINETKINDLNDKTKKRETKTDGIQQQQALLRRQNGFCRGPSTKTSILLSLNYKCPLNELRRGLQDYPGGYQNDHRIRLSDNGSNNLPNRQLLCQICHGIKTNIETRDEGECTSWEKNLLSYFKKEYEESEMEDYPN